LRRLGGNWTFVIITDRQELDEQIAGTFAAVGALTKNIDQCQAQSRVHLRELLAGQERYIFTLIHKFSVERGELMPVLSERSDIIVITDEAHRSQYDQLAANMRRALPHRERMMKEDLESKFKDAEDHLRLVFVCAMWITGF